MAVKSLDLLFRTLDELESSELKRFRTYLSERTVEGFEPIPRGKLEDKDATDVAFMMNKAYEDEGSVKMTLAILKKMNLKNLAGKLERDAAELRKRDDAILQEVKAKHKKWMIQKFSEIHECIEDGKNKTLLNKMYIELYITEGESEGVNTQHEIRRIETQTKANKDKINYTDIFKCLLEDEKIRTVMTTGIAGIGKSVCVQKFILDWAEGRSHQDVDFIFALPFRQLNLKQKKSYTLLKLLLDFCLELDEEDIHPKMFRKMKIMIIFDGLDESKLPLNVEEDMHDPLETASVDVLITNLITGNLLPNALIWITSRPAAVKRIPPKYIDRWTEVQGFNDQQKDEYFKKKIGNPAKADTAIAHIKRSKSLYIMCHIPVFCWILATVLLKMINLTSTSDLPQTLTEVYIHFLLTETNRKVFERDYKKRLETNKDAILKLSELAYKELLKGNILFYEDSLKECGFKEEDITLYSGMCSEFFKNKSMQNEDGHLDLFLRFLLGISLESNQKLLHGALTRTESSSDSLKETAQYIKRILSEDKKVPERCMNLLLCLLEMKDNTLHQEIQQYMNSGQELSPTQCSRLAYMLLVSEETLDEFDLAKYKTTRKGRNRLLVVLKACRKAQLVGCDLREDSFEVISSALQSENSLLKELDLSSNHLRDSGVRLLSAGLKHMNCKLETLRLAECKLSGKSCGIVATVLQSPNSLIELDLSHNDLGDSGVQLLSKGLSSPHCKLQTLRLNTCGISDEGYVCLFLALMLNPSCVKELDVNNNHSRGSAQKLLSATLEDPHRKALQLAKCKLSEKSYGIVATVLQSPNSLIELDLSHNDLGDSGVQLLSEGLSSPHCKLQTLRLAECKLTEKSCGIVAAVLQSPNSLIELDLSHNDLEDSGVQLLSKGLSSPHCKLQTLRLAECKLTEKSCGIVAAVLQSPNSLIELDLSHNDLGDSGVQLLFKGLSSPHCKLQTLRLAECKLTEKSCGIVAAVLQSPNSLIELDLRHNDLQDSGVQLLSKGLSSPHCKLQTLKLADCKLKDKLCEIVASVLQSPNSLLQLNFSNNDLGDSGVQLLSKGLSSSNSMLQILRLADCKLTDTSCEIVGSVLQSPNTLQQLDLSDNDLGDSGVQLLCKGLPSSNCIIHTLRLSDCLISEKGFGFLASALTSNPSHLKELDLSYNHLGESGPKRLSARLEILKTGASVSRARQHLLRDACDLTLDPNTAHRNLSLSEGNRKVTRVDEKQPYPEHPERFDYTDYCPQVLCREGLTGRCYWEAEWSGDNGARISVAYKSIKRKGISHDLIMGRNAKSWSLRCSPLSYSVMHNNEPTDIPAPSSGSRRVGVHLDWPAGTLSFYSVSSHTLTHLHTFHSTFTEPLCPGFRVDYFGSSVSLCQIT
ncbi:NACHT, LRR and PYD domains-containing protein 12-like [Sardina pilchardus]|uniref:NACHT, LRR and PYD domains-containing protein 12-like n=1 Tax=Sardina pilchardus TaxID=27697 RepID=UPI002E116993